MRPITVPTSVLLSNAQLNLLPQIINRMALIMSSFSSPAEYEIADECERRFGRKACDTQYKGYWIISKN